MGLRVRQAGLLIAVVFAACAAPATAALAQESAAPATTNAAASGGAVETLVFYVVAAVTIVSALGVCVAKNIVRMAVWLFGALGAVALLYFLLAANFLAAIQLIVYVGGTLILLVFGVMLTTKSPWVRFELKWYEPVAAGLVCAVLLTALCLLMAHTDWEASDAARAGTTVEAFGRRLLTTYVAPFEVAGVLLMIVMVGAAHLARQPKPER